MKIMKNQRIKNNERDIDTPIKKADISSSFNSRMKNIISSIYVFIKSKES